MTLFSKLPKNETRGKGGRSKLVDPSPAVFNFF